MSQLVDYLGSIYRNCMHQIERRTSPRFPLQQSVTLRPDTGTVPAIPAVTENASLTGVLIVCDTAVSEASQVEVTIVLRKNDFPTTVRLHGSGQVVRVEKYSDDKYAIAIYYRESLEETLYPQTSGEVMSD